MHSESPWLAAYRIFCRYERASERVFVLYVMRGEMLLRKRRLGKRDRENPIANLAASVDAPPLVMLHWLRPCWRATEVAPA